MTYARPMYPPPVRPEGGVHYAPFDAAAAAARDRHPLADLIRLRDEAADIIELCLAFLDVTDGLDAEEQVDDEPCDTDELEEDPSDYEPSLGWTRCGALAATDDLEIDEVAA